MVESGSVDGSIFGLSVLFDESSLVKKIGVINQDEPAEEVRVNIVAYCPFLSDKEINCSQTKAECRNGSYINCSNYQNRKK